MAGLTTTGITIKDVDEILTDIESEQLANIDPDINIEADSVLGQINGIYAAALAELVELVEEVYQSAYPDTASGQSLSYVAALTGSIRQVATKAELDVRFTGTDTTDIPAGTQIYPDGDPDSLFQTTALATISGTTVDVTVQAVTEGPATVAAGGDPLIIATPVAGISSVATIGADPFLKGLPEETDDQLRTRRQQSFLSLSGASTLGAIRSDMLTVAGVDTCSVFENVTGQVDAQGLPPNSIEVLISNVSAPGYDTTEVAQQIWDSKPAGTQTYGDLSANATDSQGNLQTVYYSEPAALQAWVKLTVLVTDGVYLGDDTVADAIEAWATSQIQVGESVYGSSIIDVVAGLVGVVAVDLASTKVDDIDPPVNSALAVTARQLVTIDADDVAGDIGASMSDQNTTITTTALSRMLSQFDGSVNLRLLVASDLDQVQAFEDAIWPLLEERSLASATGDRLDGIGEIIKIPRGGRADAAYRIALQTEFAVIQSTGTEADLLDIAQRLIQMGTPNYEFFEYFPKGVYIRAINEVILDTDGMRIVSALRRAASAATTMLFVFAEFTDSVVFTLSSQATVSESSAGIGLANLSQTTGGHLAQSH